MVVVFAKDFKHFLSFDKVLSKDFQDTKAFMVTSKLLLNASLSKLFLTTKTFLEQGPFYSIV